jgi:hypothetical protein
MLLKTNHSKAIFASEVAELGMDCEADALPGTKRSKTQNQYEGEI